MDLVERESDLGALAELLDGLLDGRSRAVAVEGPAGIGKSRLLAVLREGAGERGIRALTARGSELEREFPFGVIRQLFEPVLPLRDLGTAHVAGRGICAAQLDEAETVLAMARRGHRASRRRRRHPVLRQRAARGRGG